MAWTWVPQLMVEGVGDKAQTPSTHPSPAPTRLLDMQGKDASTFPLEASDLAEHTACQAAPSLRQIYLALILKMQLSSSFIAEIKQTRKGEKKKKASAHQLTRELAVIKLAKEKRSDQLLPARKSPPSLPLQGTPQGC